MAVADLDSGETGHRKADCDKGPLCYNCKVRSLLPVSLCAQSSPRGASATLMTVAC